MNKVSADNRRARFDYEIIEKLEVGIVLTGTEIKAIRARKINLAGSYGRIFWQQHKPELWLVGMHLGITDGDASRTRKLLLHKTELNRLIGKTQEKGLTLIPLSLYFKHRFAKILLGLGKGRKVYDKREKIKQRDLDRRMRKQKILSS